jgi:hypothetical protein
MVQVVGVGGFGFFAMGGSIGRRECHANKNKS